MAYGLGLISSYIILELSKKYMFSIRIGIISLFAIIFLWHGVIKYSIWDGLHKYYTGNYKESIIALERAVTMYPKPIGKFHIFLAEMYIDKNNYKEFNSPPSIVFLLLFLALLTSDGF